MAALLELLVASCLLRHAAVSLVKYFTKLAILMHVHVVKSFRDVDGFSELKFSEMSSHGFTVLHARVVAVSGFASQRLMLHDEVRQASVALHSSRCI